MDKEKKKCAYCGAPYEGMGKDGNPLVVGRICKDCDGIRFMMMMTVPKKK